MGGARGGLGLGWAGLLPCCAQWAWSRRGAGPEGGGISSSGLRLLVGDVTYIDPTSSFSMPRTWRCSPRSWRGSAMRGLRRERPPRPPPSGRGQPRSRPLPAAVQISAARALRGAVAALRGRCPFDGAEHATPVPSPASIKCSNPLSMRHWGAGLGGAVSERRPHAPRCHRALPVTSLPGSNPDVVAAAVAAGRGRARRSAPDTPELRSTAGGPAP